MVEIRGRYVYDDASLTPGASKDGGLHQNLFDQDGHLAANARFIPDAPEDDDLYDLTFEEPVPITSADDADEAESLVAELAALAALYVGRRYVAPWARRRWTSARAAISRRHDQRAGEPLVVEGPVEQAEPLDAEIALPQEKLSREQAEQLLMQALAAQQFSQTLLQRLQAARIIDPDQAELAAQHWAQLSVEQRTEVLTTVASDNPALLASFETLDHREERAAVSLAGGDPRLHVRTSAEANSATGVCPTASNE